MDSKSYASSKFKRSSRNSEASERRALSSAEKKRHKVIESLNELRADRAPVEEIDALVDQLKKLNTKLRKQKKWAQSSGSVPEILSKLTIMKDILLDPDSSILPDGVSSEFVIKLLSGVSTALFSMNRDRSCTNVSIQLTNLCLQYVPHKHLYHVLDLIVTASGVVYSDFMAMAQSGDSSSEDSFMANKIWDFLSSTSDILHDQRWSEIKSFIIKASALMYSSFDIVSYEHLDLETAMSKFSLSKKCLKDGCSLFEGLMEAYLFIVQHWTNLLSGDWSCLLLGKEESEDWEERVQTLMQQGTLYLKGCFTEMETKYSMSEKVFEAKLEACIKDGNVLSTKTTNHNAKMTLQRYMRDLKDLETKIYILKSDSPTRLQPCGVLMSGPSNCGKSQLISMLNKVIMKAYGHDFDPSDIVFSNIAEKFDSNVMPKHKIIVCDDVANNKNGSINFDRILNYVNVVPRPLEKASTEEKGKLFPLNDALIVSTNVESLRAEDNSACPDSILRRFCLNISVKVAKEFRNEYGGLIDLPDMNLGVYELELKVFSKYEGSVPQYEVIPHCEWNPTGDHKHDVPFMLKFLRSHIQKFIKTQKLKQASQADFLSAGFCSECQNPSFACLCSMPSPEAQSISGVQAAATEHWHNAMALLNWRVNLVSWKLSNMRFMFSVYLFLISNSRVILSAIASDCALFVFLRCMGVPFVLSFAAFVIVWQIVVRKMRSDLDRQLSRRRDALSSAVLSTKAICKKYAPYAAASVALAYLFVKLWRQSKVDPDIKPQDTSTFLEASHDVFAPLMQTPREKFHRPMNDESDYKEGYSRMPPSMSEMSKTTTARDLHSKVERSMRVVSIKDSTGTINTVNGILVKGNILLVPNHLLCTVGSISIETTPHPGVPGAKTKDQDIQSDQIYSLPNSDMALVHLPSCPAGSDISGFFLKDLLDSRSRPTVLVTKTHDNKVIKSFQPIRPYLSNSGGSKLEYSLRTHKKNFFGANKIETIRIDAAYECQLEFNSYAGLCGSLYMDMDRALIYGFHVAGVEGTPRSFLSPITQDMLHKGITALEKSSYSMVLASKGEVQVAAYGQPFSIVDGLPLYKMAGGLGSAAVCTYMGKVLKNGEAMVEAVKTPYMRTPFNRVQDVFGSVKSIPPTQPNSVDKGLLTLNKLHAPVQHKEHGLLKRAYADFRDKLLEVVDQNREEAESLLRFYTKQEALDGLHTAGMGGMPNSTSAGFPLNCSKKKIMKKDPMDESLPLIPREFVEDSGVDDKIAETWDAWSRGERSEPIFRASSKVNELLPKKKAIEKVRKFYGSPIDFLVCSRRVLGGLVLFMRNHQAEFECFVGMNPCSKEWGEFHSFVTSHGGIRMVAGDFSGFDTTMSQQISTTASQIILDLYQSVGVSDEELLILRSCLSDICNPNVLFMGDLYNFANMNPSGQPITVQLNSLVNSLLMRYVFFAIYPQCKSAFDTHVSLATYGDDNLMDVDKRFPLFNHTNCQTEFLKIGIKYTMADKDAESVGYIDSSQTSFLKRGFRWCPILKEWVAPIEEESITKKFHFVKKPNESPLSSEEQFAAHCDNAFREAFLLGEEYYTSFCSKIKTIVSANSSLHGRIPFYSLDDMALLLKPYYANDYKGGNPHLFAESMGIDVLDL